MAASPQKIGIIGSGLAGLSAACTLAARGHQVTVFDKSPWLGGKAASLQKDGYRFDMGPTILTIPDVLKRIFQEANKPIEKYLDLIRLDPQWRCFYEGGNTLDLVADEDAMATYLNSRSPGSGDGYKKFLTFSRRMNRVTENYFFWRSVGGIKDMIDWKASFQPGLIRDVMAMRMGRSVADTVRKYVPDPQVAQMLDHFVQYVGSSPAASPAVLCGIAHMQTGQGVWYPRGGIRAIPEALIQLGNELGVKYLTGAAVRRIITKGKAVAGLELESGDRYDFDAIISNSDAVRTHRELLQDSGKTSKTFEKRRKYEPACSGVVLYLGLDRRYEQLLHHNFVFSHDPEVEFDAIYHRGEPAEDMTCYVCAPTISEPEVAPAGHEALYVLVHTPYLRPHHQWATMFPEYRQKILAKLERCAGLVNLEKHIRFEAHLTPQSIHDRYRVLNGAIYGIASHGKFLGAFKPANRSPDISGLYLAGGAAHPGPGMPMVLMSGWIAASTLDSDAKAKMPALVKA